jgi:hypothetical protein
VVPREDALSVEMTRRRGFAIAARCHGTVPLAGMPLRIEMAELDERWSVAGFGGLVEKL